jgi:hypothetical protein
MRTSQTGHLRVVMRFPASGRAVAHAARMAAKYGPKFAVIEDRDFANGGGDDYPYATVTPYAYPYNKR